MSASSEAGQRDSDDSCHSVAAINTGDNDVNMEETDANEENIDINIQQIKQSNSGQEITKDLKYFDDDTREDVSNDTMDQDESEVTEITLTTDSEGRYIITTSQNLVEGEGQSIHMPENKEFEDSMYNLQMLGEVALKNQTDSASIL